MLKTMGWISIVPVALAVIRAASDHIDHVNTQLPYALTVAGLCTVTYLTLGIIVA